MAARSPSPNPTRPTNLHPKTPESSSSIRRSGSFNLSKPSISSEIPQRNSNFKAGRDLLPCLRASFEQKENERDPNFSKTPRVRSPAMSSSKIVKNFMAPTISASSKAIAASPRNKILAERNEVIGVTRSLEFPLRDAISSKPEMGSRAQTVLGASKVIGTKSEMYSGFQEILGSTESTKMEPEIKNNKYIAIPSCTPSPIIPHPVAEPSFPPYDPKTNYLSPRPRFLHYKPKPPVEQCCNKKGSFFDVRDGKQLENSFSSENQDNTFGDTVEAQSAPPQDKEESFLTMEEAEVVTDGTHVSETEFEPKPNSSKPSKSRYLTRSKVLPLLLVVIFACLYAPLLDSPVISSSMLTNFNGLADRFRDWSMRSVAYLNPIVSLPQAGLGSFDLANLTFSAVDFDNAFRTPNLEQVHLEIETDQAIKKNMIEGENCWWHETERKTAMENPEGMKEDVKEHGPEKMGMEILEDVKEEVGKNFEVPGDLKADVDHMEYQIENKTTDDGVEEMEQEKITSSHEALEDEEGSIIMEVSEDVEEDAHPVESERKNVIEEDGLTEVEQEKSSSSHGMGTQPTHFDDTLTYSRDKYDDLLSDIGSEDELSMQAMFGISLAVLLVAIMVFLLVKEKQTNVAAHKGLLPPKKLASVSGSSESYGHAKGSPYENVPMGGDIVSDSGPSEVSSSLHSSSSFSQQKTRRVKAEQETLSNERRPRRDSVASSSFSYGSFTTYERLSAKKLQGCKDEDAATPVRRSSRIRNLVTSP